MKTEIVGYTIPRLTTAFEKVGYRLELVAVDNGSSDRTGEIIRRIAAQNKAVIPHRVDENEGYGNGILSGIPICTAPWVGIIPADGQVDAEDVVRLYEAVIVTKRWSPGQSAAAFPHGWPAAQMRVCPLQPVRVGPLAAYRID